MASQHHPRVGFCGLGAMGSGMANQLLEHGFVVRGFDIHRPCVDKLIQAGGKPAATPAEAAADAEVLLIMVTGPTQVSAVLFGEDNGAVPKLPKNAAIIVSSTVPPDYCMTIRTRLDDEFRRSDIHLLDCPVSGGTTGAAAGTLSIFSSGPEHGLQIAHPVLKAMSSILYKIPGGIGSGSKAKMCHQVAPEVGIALVAEAMAFAVRAGLNTQEVFDAVQDSDGASWVNGNRIPHVLEGDTTIYSVLPNCQKDSSIIVDTSRLISFPVLLVAVAEQVYEAGAHAGWAKDDDSTLARLYLREYPDDVIHQLTKADSAAAKGISGITVQDVIDIFAGVNLAASAEAMGFTEAVGLDTDVMFNIISKAAGSNVQFVENVPKMKKPSWSLKDVDCAKDVGRRLANAMAKANSIGAAMPLTAASLQLFHLQLGQL